jgi:hypothetical protein
MKIKSIAKTSFLVGFIASSCIRSLIKDYYGQAEMIEKMKTAWISSAITVPLACTILLATIVIFMKTIKLELWFKAYTNQLLTEWGKGKNKDNG